MIVTNKERFVLKYSILDFENRIKCPSVYEVQ